MATEIVTRTIGAEIDKRIRLSNGYIVRKTNSGINWGTMRIGIRYSMVPEANTLDLTGTPRLGFGVCSSVTDPYGSRTPDHFWGIRSNQATWTYKNSNPDYFGASGGDALEYQAFKVQDGAVTVSEFGTAAQASITAVAEPSTNRSMGFVDITKTGSTMTFVKHGPTTAAAAKTDMNEKQFFNIMDVEIPLASNSPINGYTISDTITLAADGANIAADEASFGNLDHICIYWDRKTTLLELCDIAWAVKA